MTLVFKVKFENQEKIVIFKTLSDAIAFGSRDLAGRHFTVTYEIGEIAQVIYSSKGSRSA